MKTIYDIDQYFDRTWDSFIHFRIPYLNILFLFPIIFIFSCQKDVNIQEKGIADLKGENPYIWYLAMKQKKENLSFRESGITVSAALEYSNDGLNFLYCRPNDFYAETIMFRDTFSLTVSSGRVDEGDVATLMEDIAEFAGGKFYDEIRSDKEPLLFSMTQVSSPSPSYVNIEASFYMEAGLPIDAEDEYPYDASWIYGQKSEDVTNVCNSEGQNYDAVDLFRRDLRRLVTYRSKVDHYYFENPTIYCFSPFDEYCDAYELPFLGIPDVSINFEALRVPLDEEDNLHDYYLFFNNDAFSNFDECLSVGEMNFYYTSMANLVEDQLPSPPTNVKIIQIEVGYQEIQFIDEVIWHAMGVIYGTKTPVSEPDYDPMALPCCP